MKKSFKLQDLDCANCAAKMETGIRKIPGVTYAAVSFLAQKLTLEADDDQFEDILNQAAAVIKKVDSDCALIIE